MKKSKSYTFYLDYIDRRMAHLLRHADAFPCFDGVYMEPPFLTDDDYREFEELATERKKEVKRLQKLSDAPQAMTPVQVAKRLHVAKNKIHQLIKRGSLKATNMADPGKPPRYIILPEQLAEFLKHRESTSPTPKPPRKGKLAADEVDYYPE